MKIFRVKLPAETVVSFLFFFSGLTSLVYEVLFVRVFGLVIGNTFLAVSTVLVLYMMEMALGGGIFGKTADRSGRPMCLYAVLEGGVVISALAVFLIRGLFEKFFLVLPGNPFGRHLVQFVAVFAALLPMTAMIGGTLPAVARAVVRDFRTKGSRIGSLYAVNTAGAVAGVFLAGSAAGVRKRTPAPSWKSASFKKRR